MKEFEIKLLIIYLVKIEVNNVHINVDSFYSESGVVLQLIKIKKRVIYKVWRRY